MEIPRVHWIWTTTKRYEGGESLSDGIFKKYDIPHHLVDSLILISIQQQKAKKNSSTNNAMHTSALLAVLGSAALTRSHPTKRHTSLAPRGIANLDAFRLPMMANYTSARDSKAPQHNMMPFAPSDPVEVATEHVKKMNPGLTFRVVSDHYVGSNGISHIRFKQTMHGIDIDNADYNVNVSTFTSPSLTPHYPSLHWC